MTSTNNLTRILHIADSALPIGGYAYSYGLEYAVKSGMISSVSGLKRYLVEFLKQLQTFDLAFIIEAYNHNSEDKMNELSELYTAMLLNNKIKTSGEVIGRNWVRLMSKVYPNIATQVDTKQCADFLLVYGKTCKMIGLSLTDCVEMFLYMTLRDQVGAIIRLGTMGPTKAHELQHELLEEITSQLCIDTIPQVEKAYKTAYMLELAQLAHKNLYTKLFQN